MTAPFVLPAALPGEVAARVATYLTDLHLAPAVRDVVLLNGDASTRRYLRVHLNDTSSLVLAVYAEPIDVPTSSWATIGRLLQAIPLPVPEILHFSSPLGIIGLEDLGDVTLQAHIAERPSDREHCYSGAVDHLITLQQRGAALAHSEGVPYTAAFDREKLTWELRFFVEHFLGSHRGVPLTHATHQALDREWDDIAGELAAEPRIVCHRDYHSRNLMIHKQTLWVIDFQDARMGPDTYDLASLLRDSYVDLEPKFVSQMIDRFLWERALRSGSFPPSRQEFQRRFDLMALQRNLKALGTFGYQGSVRGVSTYLTAIPRTLAYVRATLLRDQRFATLGELLASAVEELA